MKKDVCLTVQENSQTVFYGEVLDLDSQSIIIEVCVTDAVYEITPKDNGVVIIRAREKA